MTRRRLTNEEWAVDTCCFVCEPDNARGLGLAFYAEDEAVVSAFRLGDGYSGAPNFVHGGVTLAILDEAMAWATIALAGRFALTASTSADFLGPVFVDHDYEVAAWIDQASETEISTHGVVRQGEQTLVKAAATFVVVSEAKAVEAGASLTDRQFFRDG